MKIRNVRKRGPSAKRRRGVVAVQVAVAMTVIVGFAALTIDVGAMYSAKADLQRAVDAAAMAAAAQLASQGDVETLAKDTAERYIAANSVVGENVTFNRDDVGLYRAVLVNGSYSLLPSGAKNAVKVVVHYTMPLSFAGIFGKTSTDMTAEGTAMLVPRDIAIVADLSASHNDDSELRHYKETNINLHEVWDDFPGGIGDAISSWTGTEFAVDGNGYSPQMAGPAWGLFKRLGYGTETIDASFDPRADSGLVELKYNHSWNNAVVQSFLADQGYIQAEIDAIMSESYDRNGAWDERVAVALGFARWNSGIPGGLWEQLGMDPGDAGNGNNWVGGGELTWQETFGNRSVSASKSIWQDYINRYMNRTWTQMYRANRDFRYRFGIKTFINYLMERRPRNSQTPEFADSRAQPMQAVKDAVGILVQTVYDLQSQDQLSLEVYDTRGRHEVDLHEPGSDWSTDEVVVTLNSRQAGHEDPWTNIGAGILRAREELSSSRARSSARKVILLITDGYANVASEYGNGGDYTGGKLYAQAEADLAAGEAIQIFTVSVGSYADLNLMEAIAQTGGGEHLAASGATVEEMSVQLNAIFQHLGGRRQVELIE